MFGMSLESLYEDPSLWEKYIHPQDKARIRNAFNNKIPTNTYDEEFRIVKEDGVVQWVRDRAYSVSDENGNLKLIAGTTQYITKAKEAEFKLKETTENLIQIMETIPSGILIIDQNYKTVFINKFLMNILALSKEDVYVKNILKILNKGFFDELQDRIQDIYEKHKTKSEEVNFINFINEEFWVEIKATRIHFNGQECILVTVNDITKLKIAQHAV